MLWIGGASGVPPSRFTLSPALLDAKHTTNGNTVPLLPGVSYSVSCVKDQAGPLRRGRIVRIDATVTIEPTHRNMRIWLLTYPAETVMPRHPSEVCAAIVQGTTVYRTGCWRSHHLGRIVSDLY